jgi:hypothetical protein
MRHWTPHKISLQTSDGEAQALWLVLPNPRRVEHADLRASLLEKQTHYVHVKEPANSPLESAQQYSYLSLSSLSTMIKEVNRQCVTLSILYKIHNKIVGKYVNMQQKLSR